MVSTRARKSGKGNVAGEAGKAVAKKKADNEAPSTRRSSRRAKKEKQNPVKKKEEKEEEEEEEEAEDDKDEKEESAAAEGAAEEEAKPARSKRTTFSEDFAGYTKEELEEDDYHNGGSKDGSKDGDSSDDGEEDDNVEIVTSNQAERMEMEFRSREKNAEEWHRETKKKGASKARGKLASGDQEEEEEEDDDDALQRALDELRVLKEQLTREKEKDDCDGDGGGCGGADAEEKTFTINKDARKSIFFGDSGPTEKAPTVLHGGRTVIVHQKSANIGAKKLYGGLMSGGGAVRRDDIEGGVSVDKVINKMKRRRKW